MQLRRRIFFSSQPRLEHTPPPHEHPRNEQGRGRKTNDRPNNFYRDSREPAKVRFREPGQHLIPKPDLPAGYIRRRKEVDGGVERGRNRKENPRDRPHKKEREG